MNKRFITWAFIFVLLVPGVLLPQVRGQARMMGVVLDEETGQPVEGVTVKAYFPAGDASYLPSPTTNKEGKWKVFFIRAGMWNLDFEKAARFRDELVKLKKRELEMGF